MEKTDSSSDIPVRRLMTRTAEGDYPDELANAA